ncbi:hypothetical protein [Luteibacter yeojuensis]|uniref:Wadjet protein JetD C-terminal domain-containing protein n=1 Tax=Luteibacter yeojuensis TaxID=345309 RepID=A0A7X5QY66_9GAMM|nr:hypothetical protein [Luteibacter yeojuensis]NID17505.1 hypothetical protein [Luteibacter yeojuensis]
MTRATDRTWGSPDEEGIRTSYASASRLARWRLADAGARSIATLLGEERALVVDLLRGNGSTVKGRTLFAKAGNARHVAIAAADYLLTQGWIELSEKRRGSQWDIVAMRWLDADGLRDRLNLPRRDTEAARRAEALASPPKDERLAGLHASLRTLAMRTLIRRAALVAKLDTWCAGGLNGTRNSFAQFAVDDTHGMTAADWHWMANHVDLDELGISRHTPALWLRAPLRLGFRGGRHVDLSPIPDMIALSPLTVSGIERIEGGPLAWVLVENRTSFEGLARTSGDRFAVVWMPGYVPDWWLEAMQVLSRLVPVPALIAADPDPAGIAIAMRASKPWGSRWKPLAMSPAALIATGRRKPLTDHDLLLLAGLPRAGLHPTLAALADALAEHGRKGEQEALDLSTWIDQ